MWRKLGVKQRYESQAIKHKNGQVIAEDVKVSERFNEYFELLDFEEERKAIVVAIGEGGQCLC